MPANLLRALFAALCVMKMITKKIFNDSDKPITLQFEPWADLLYLLPNEELTICLGETEDEDFEIEKDTDTWYVHMPFAHGYGILENGEVIEHTDYGSNIVGYEKSLNSKSSLKGSVPLHDESST